MELKSIKDNIIFNDESLVKRSIWATKDVLCFTINIKKGQTVPPHKHENTTLILFVMQGKGEICINNEKQQVSPMDSLLVKGEDDFSVPLVSEDLSLLVTISPNPTDEIYSKNIG
jgi:quercetin dioxygenase-like cupin family protein